MLEEEKKNGYENFLQEIIVKNFPNMGKEIANHIQDMQSPIQHKFKKKTCWDKF